MLKLIVFCAAAAVLVLVVASQSDNMLGPGRWFVINIATCENDEQYDIRFKVQRKKLNRTHDGFCATMNLTTDIDNSYAVRIDLCKHVDGGCKPYQVLSDDCFVNFCNKYAKENVRKAFTLGGVEPPELPLPAGDYVINDYMFDYCELPSNGVYGMFDADAYLLLDDKEVACVSFTVEFRDIEAECGQSEKEDD